MINIYFFLIFCGLISTYIADKKNRNLLFWSVAGFFFGPLSVFTIMILPKIEKKTNTNGGGA